MAFLLNSTYIRHPQALLGRYNIIHQESPSKWRESDGLSIPIPRDGRQQASLVDNLTSIQRKAHTRRDGPVHTGLTPNQEEAMARLPNTWIIHAPFPYSAQQ